MQQKHKIGAATVTTQKILNNIYTLPETNTAPENQWLEHEISFWGPDGPGLF